MSDCARILVLYRILAWGLIALKSMARSDTSVMSDKSGAIWRIVTYQNPTLHIPYPLGDRANMWLYWAMNVTRANIWLYWTMNVTLANMWLYWTMTFAILHCGPNPTFQPTLEEHVLYVYVIILFISSAKVQAVAISLQAFINRKHSMQRLFQNGLLLSKIRLIIIYLKYLPILYHWNNSAILFWPLHIALWSQLSFSANSKGALLYVYAIPLFFFFFVCFSAVLQRSLAVAMRSEGMKRKSLGAVPCRNGLFLCKMRLNITYSVLKVKY